MPLADTIHGKVSVEIRAQIDEYARIHGLTRSKAVAQLLERGLNTLQGKGFGNNCCGGKLFGYCVASACGIGDVARV
jgi:hypothetical protein